MKTFTALLALTLTACLSLNAEAQNVAGTWQTESVSSVEPPEGAALTLTFGDESKATVTYTLAGESQSWHYTYAVADGQLTLKPAKPFGKPQPVTYDIKINDGKLSLLTPKPAQEEDAAEEEPEDTESEEAEEAEEVAEEDTRTPVWVLVTAAD